MVQDQYTLRFKLASQKFDGRFMYVHPDGSQLALEDVQCESTLVLTGKQGFRWNYKEQIVALKAWADARLSEALLHSPALHRTSPFTVQHGNIQGSDCTVVSFIYDPMVFRPLEAANHLGCCSSLPQPSSDTPPIQPPISALSELPTEIHIIDDLTDILKSNSHSKSGSDAENSVAPGWHLFHALKLRVPSQSPETHADEPQQAGLSSAV